MKYGFIAVLIGLLALSLGAGDGRRVVTVDENGVLNVEHVQLRSKDGSVTLDLWAENGGAWVQMINRQTKQMVNMYSCDFGGGGQSAVGVTKLPMHGGYDSCLSIDAKTGESILQVKKDKGSVQVLRGSDLTVLQP